MAKNEQFDESVSRWLEDTAPARLPERVLHATFERTRSSKQHVGWRALLGRMTMPRFVPALGSATAVLIVAVLAFGLYVNRPGIGGDPSPTPPASPTVAASPRPVDLGIFERVAGRIVYEAKNGIWAVDPASSDPTTTVQLTSEAGTPLGWSSDGTRLLIQKGDENLFVLHADGSETQVTDQLSGFKDIPGSARPSGATISPDGSRVVFAGLTKSWEGNFCHDGALFAVDADGGPAELLWESQRDGIVRHPTFSPDGTRIAYVDGYCDKDHSVWVMNADGSDAHQIVSSEIGPLGAGHVYGLAWSAAGDRIALAFSGDIYTFATDGSDFTRIAGADTTCDSAQSCMVHNLSGVTSPYWSPDGSQIAYTTGCVEGADVPGSREGCMLAIADADGANPREFDFATSGPWHPGTPSPSVEPTTTESPSVEPTAPPPSPSATASPSTSPEPTAPPLGAEVTELLNGFLEARVAGEGAQQYLHSLYPDIHWEDVPLLYATSSGAPYERAEFEQLSGIDWPYGFRAFKVRLFAGDTVVEQLLFVGADGPPTLGYDPHGFATHIAPTTEDGQPVALAYNYFDGDVTLHAAHPWVLFDDGFPFGRLIPEGPGVRPTTDGAERNDWDEIWLMADPALLGADCQPAPNAADAEALAESIRSDPDLEATAPVVVGVGGAEALMMDVKIAAGTTVCTPATSGGDPLWNAVLHPVFDRNAEYVYDNGVSTGHATGEWMRLYLFDTPEGSSMRILAFAIVAPESRFERAVEAAAPVIDSIEFNAP